MNKKNEFFKNLGKLLEKSIINYKDLSNELINICKSKREDFIFKMKLVSKEEMEIVKKRLDNIENIVEKKNKKKNQKGKNTSTLSPPNSDFPNCIFPP